VKPHQKIARGYTEKVMSILRPDDTLTASWQQVEDFLASLHECARTLLEPRQFYGKLIDGCVRTLAANAGVVWQADVRGRWQTIAEFNLETVLSDPQVKSAHAKHLPQTGEPRVVLPGGGNGIEQAILSGAITADSARARLVVELFLRPNASPATQEGWEEFLRAVIAAAQTFESQHELRTLRAERSSHAEVLALLRRIHSGKTLAAVAFDLANEGARYLGADRLSVLLKRGDFWKLIAASGVEHVEARAEAVKDLESLAEVTAHWGEPLDYSELGDVAELPPVVAQTLQRHIDHSHARRLVAVPVEFRSDDESRTAGAVLIAENFAGGDTLPRERVVELAELCEPALAQVVAWDRWPIRPVIEWTNWWSRVWQSWGISRIGLIAGAALAVLLMLTFVKTDFEIEATATLMPRSVRDVFATADGTVQAIKVAHGEQVEQGAVLATLEDPQLELEAERIRGELETVRKRLEAIAVARTDRQTREELSPDRLPLSAEAKQLELRHASLLEQQAILTKQREALTLRSPIAGTVLTLDVQNLLRGRPVERGQVLFTVGDGDSGWELETRVPQDAIGHVVAAAEASDEALGVRFRLAGDREHTYTGHVAEIAQTAVVDPEQLAQEPPEVRVRVAVDKEKLLVAKPEMQARVRIDCGRRSLGYVWLHEVWDNIYSWLAF
jgi:multidrug efflux pump subunit AcrA (membrane-fusion protein)